MVNMHVTKVSHSCLLIELNPICNSMAASLCLKSCKDHCLLKSYNGGLRKKQLLVKLYFLENASTPKPSDIATSNFEAAFGLKVKVKGKILYFLVNVSTPKALDVELCR